MYESPVRCCCCCLLHSLSTIKRPRSERISRTKRNGERIFCFEKKNRKKTSQHTKKILFFLFLTLCFELCFYTNQFLLPITFLRVMLCIFFCCSRHERKSFLFFLQPTEESHLHNHYQQRDNTTHDRGELLYLFSMYQNHFILKIAIVKSWVWVEVNV